MAKKKKRSEPEVSKSLFDVFDGSRSEISQQELDDLKMMADTAMQTISAEEREVYQMMCALASSGVSPDDYAEFYDIFQTASSIVDNMSSDSEDTEDDFPIRFNPTPFGQGRCGIKEYRPLVDASDRTLVLKIQMKDVTKPPMWREVEIPADFNFLHLHEVIQDVTGLNDYHLWQFNKKAYDSSLQIAVGMDEDNPFSMGVEEVTHEAEETPVTQFLQKKGDKLEYVYDFGDDWIFEISVKDLLDKKIEYPVCLKYKSELNAIEDFGGVWSYTQAREELENWPKLSKKQRTERVDRCGFETEHDYLEFLNSHRISLDDVNDILKGI